MSEHLDLAREYLAIAESGDSKREAYRHAAEEIAAAVGDGMTQVAVATAIGKSRVLVRQLLDWRKTGYAADTPWLADTKATGRAAASHTRKVLREAPLEQVEQIISELPKERQQAIAAAAGSGYDKAVLTERERVRTMTPAQRKEVEAAKGAITAPYDKALGAFSALGVINHIEMATEGVAELIEKRALTPKDAALIAEATKRLTTELEVAFAMAGLDEEAIA